MSLEDTYFRVASVLSPVTSSTANSSLKDLDPVLYYLLQYFVGVIGLHCSGRFDAEVIKMGRPDLAGKIISQAIAYDPLPIATEDQYKFPLLCAYRSDETYDLKTVTWYHITSKINVMYVLPPLTSDQQKALIPLLTHINRVIVDRTFNGLDSQYLLGSQVWKESGLEQIGTVSSTYGKFPGLKNKEESNIWFPGICIEMQALERRMPVDENFVSFQGMDGYIEAANSIDNGIFEVDVIETL